MGLRFRRFLLPAVLVFGSLFVLYVGFESLGVTKAIADHGKSAVAQIVNITSQHRRFSLRKSGYRAAVHFTTDAHEQIDTSVALPDAMGRRIEHAEPGTLVIKYLPESPQVAILEDEDALTGIYLQIVLALAALVVGLVILAKRLLRKAVPPPAVAAGLAGAQNRSVDLDFNTLPLDVREDLVEALKSREPGIGPMLCNAPPLLKPIIWHALAVVSCLMFLFLLVELQLGELGAPRAWLPGEIGIFMVAMTIVLIYCTLAILWRLTMRTALPFPPGVYAFPLYVIDARSRLLRIYPLSRLENLELNNRFKMIFFYQGSAITFDFYKGPSFRFRINDRKGAKEALAQLENNRKALSAGGVLKKSPAFEPDPLAKVRAANWAVLKAASKSDPLTARHVPAILRRRAIVALAAGVVIGGALWFGRNLISDTMQYQEAKRLNTERAYTDYLGGGWMYATEAEATLPRAAFNEAKRSGNVVRLRNVARRYPDAGLAPDVAQAVDAIYVAALEKYRQQAATADPATLPFMEQLVEALRKAGNSTVQLHFQRPAPEPAPAAESATPQPTRQFADQLAGKHAAEREARTLTMLAKGFKTALPGDTVMLTAVPKLDPHLPAMDVSYKIAPAAATAADPTGSGAAVEFDVSMALPDAAPGWNQHFLLQPADNLEALPPPAPSVMRGVTPAETPAFIAVENVFEQFGAKLRDAFFNPDSDAYKRAAAP